MSQERNGNSLEKLGQMNFFGGGGEFFGWLSSPD